MRRKRSNLIHLKQVYPRGHYCCTPPGAGFMKSDLALNGRNNISWAAPIALVFCPFSLQSESNFVLAAGLFIESIIFRQYPSMAIVSNIDPGFESKMSDQPF